MTYFCPKCGETMSFEREQADYPEFLYCAKGKMGLSQKMTEAVIGRYGEGGDPASIRDRMAYNPKLHRSAYGWFCPGCGKQLSKTCECEACGKSIRDMIYQLIELHPHRDRGLSFEAALNQAKSIPFTLGDKTMDSLAAQILIICLAFALPTASRQLGLDRSSGLFWALEIGILGILLVCILKIPALRSLVLGGSQPQIIHNVDPNSLRAGDFKHEKLAPETEARLRRVFGRLSEVDPTPINEIIDNFRHDAHPDKELDLWEHAADVYEAFFETRQGDLKKKNAVFSVVAGFLIRNESNLSGKQLAIPGVDASEAEWLRDKYYR